MSWARWPLIGIIFALAIQQPTLADLAQSSTLVLASNNQITQTHSQFLASLAAAGAELDVRCSSNSSLQLRSWDTWLYSNVIFLHPDATELGGAIDFGQFVEFVEGGGNLMLAVDSSISEALRELASDLGVDIEPSGASVIDHFSFWPEDPSHRTVLASDYLPSEAMWGRTPQAAVTFRGIGMSVSPDSTMANIVLHAGPAAYSAMSAPNPRDNLSLAGHQIGLAAISQTRSAARVVVVGSLHSLSNAAFAQSIATSDGANTASNAHFGTSLGLWLLHKRGILRFGKFVHHRVGEHHSPDAYTIKDQLHFEVKIDELVNSHWQPYRASDVQLEFTMLDPHVRLSLQHNDEGLYSADFQVPDVYGVFKFVIQYAPPGYNSIDLSQQVPVRPYKHTEFERFLSPAYPYYASGLTNMIAFLALTIVYLYS